jgi:hypothetical protein
MPLNKPSAPKKNDDGDDFDDLAKRLAALKKK